MDKICRPGPFRMTQPICCSQSMRKIAKNNYQDRQKKIVLAQIWRKCVLWMTEKKNKNKKYDMCEAVALAGVRIKWISDEQFATAFLLI